MTVHNLIEGLPGKIPGQVLLYLAERKISVDHCAQVDVVLALLWINTPETLAIAQRLCGRPIRRCPAYIPQWPPLPVQRAGGPRLGRVVRNPCLPTTDMFQRYQLLRPGATREQLLSRGVTARDLRYWSQKDYIEWRTA